MAPPRAGPARHGRRSTRSAASTSRPRCWRSPGCPCRTTCTARRSSAAARSRAATCSASAAAWTSATTSSGPCATSATSTSATTCRTGPTARAWATCGSSAATRTGSSAHLDGELDVVQERVLGREGGRGALRPRSATPTRSATWPAARGTATSSHRLRRVLDDHLVATNDNGFIPEGSPLEGHDAEPCAGRVPDPPRPARSPRPRSSAIRTHLDELRRARSAIANEAIRYWAAQGSSCSATRREPAVPALNARLAGDPSASGAGRRRRGAGATRSHRPVGRRTWPRPLDTHADRAGAAAGDQRADLRRRRGAAVPRRWSSAPRRPATSTSATPAATCASCSPAPITAELARLRRDVTARPICGPTRVTSGLGCCAQSGGATPARSAAMRAKWRSKPASRADDQLAAPARRRDW